MHSSTGNAIRLSVVTNKYKISNKTIIPADKNKMEENKQAPIIMILMCILPLKSKKYNQNNSFPFH